VYALLLNHPESVGSSAAGAGENSNHRHMQSECLTKKSAQQSEGKPTSKSKRPRTIVAKHHKGILDKKLTNKQRKKKKKKN
jgi:hypothetical protein